MTRHEQLLKAYVAELTAAKKFADAWWTQLHARERQAAGLPQSAGRAIAARWRDGPASHPRVLAVIRKYWLACQELNHEIALDKRHAPGPPEPEYVLEPEAPDEEEEAEAETEVYPHIFVLEWLMEDDTQELADFLGTLSYWPMGRKPHDPDHYV